MAVIMFTAVGRSNGYGNGCCTGRTAAPQVGVGDREKEREGELMTEKWFSNVLSQIYGQIENGLRKKPLKGVGKGRGFKIDGLIVKQLTQDEDVKTKIETDLKE